MKPRYTVEPCEACDLEPGDLVLPTEDDSPEVVTRVERHPQRDDLLIVWSGDPEGDWEPCDIQDNFWRVAPSPESVEAA